MRSLVEVRGLRARLFSRWYVSIRLWGEWPQAFQARSSLSHSAETDESTEFDSIPAVVRHAATGVLVQSMEARYAKTGLDRRLEKFREVYQPLRLYEELALARGLLEGFLESYEAQNALLQRCAAARDQPLPAKLLGPADAIQHLRLVADLVKMIHSLEGADLVAKLERRQLVSQIGLVVEQEVQRTEETPPGWQRALLLRIRERWLKIVT